MRNKNREQERKEFQITCSLNIHPIYRRSERNEAHKRALHSLYSIDVNSQKKLAKM